jgi:predicted phage terminase large subunit-like protein
MKRKRTVGNYFWHAEYMQDPRPPEGNLLNPQMLQYYDRTPNVRQYKTRVMAVDLAYSESKNADETAVTILDVDTDGFYVDNQICWKRDTNYTQKELIKLYNYYHPDAFYMETIGFQHVVRDNLVKLGIPVMPFEDRRNKEVKIGELAPHLDNGKIFLKYPKDQWEVLEDQIASFPLAPHDDRVESLWMAVKMAEKAGNPYSTKGEGKYYDYSPRGQRRGQEKNRPQLVHFDRDNNPYSVSYGRR